MERDYNPIDAMRRSKEEDYGTEGQSLRHSISYLQHASKEAMKPALNNAVTNLTNKKIKTNSVSAVNTTNVKKWGGGTTMNDNNSNYGVYNDEINTAENQAKENKNVLEEFLEDTRPGELDKERQSRNQSYAHIGDSVKVLADMLRLGTGAYAKERNGSEIADRVRAENKQEKEKYDNDLKSFYEKIAAAKSTDSMNYMKAMSNIAALKTQAALKIAADEKEKEEKKYIKERDEKADKENARQFNERIKSNRDKQKVENTRYSDERAEDELYSIAYNDRDFRESDFARYLFDYTGNLNAGVDRNVFNHAYRNYIYSKKPETSSPVNFVEKRAVNNNLSDHWDKFKK